MVFLPSFNNKPLATTEDLYKAYCDIAKLFFESIKPTPEEIKFVNFEIADIGMEDLLCDPSDPTAGGDIGLLACSIYEMREAAAADQEEKK